MGYKDRAMKELKVENTELSPIMLASSVPKSDIVFGFKSANTTGDRVNSLRESAYLLYNKYIAVGSEFEINISGKMRSKLKAMMSDHDAWMAMDIAPEKLCGVFDDANIAMRQFLQNSRPRFLRNLRCEDPATIVSD